MQAISSFDVRLTSLIQQWPKSLQPSMVLCSILGEPILVLTIGFAGYMAAVQRGNPQIQRAFLYCAIAYGISVVLKLLLHRNRPHDLKITTLGLTSYSFPSGHAFGAVILYGLFAYLSKIYLVSPWTITVILALWALIILIGLSRVYLKAHYPSDVAGGWMLGIISLVVIIKLAF